MISQAAALAQNWGSVSQNFYQAFGSAPNYNYNPLTGLWDITGFTMGDILTQNTDAGTMQEILHAFGGLRGAWMVDSTAIEQGINGINPITLNPVTIIRLQPSTPDSAGTENLRGITNNILNLDANNPTRSVWDAIKANTPAQVTLGTGVQVPLEAAYFGEIIESTSVGLFVAAQPDLNRPLSVGFGGSVYGQYNTSGIKPQLPFSEEVGAELNAPQGVDLFSAHGHFGVYRAFNIPALGRLGKGYVGGGTIAGTYFPAHTTAARPDNVGRTTGFGGFAETGLQAPMGAGSLRSGFRIGWGEVFNGGGSRFVSRDLFLTYTLGRIEISSRATYEMWGANKGGLFLRTQFGYIISTQGLSLPNNLMGN